MQTPFEKRENNIDFIRLSLSILVIFSHSYNLALRPNAPDPLAALTRWEATLGSVAVDVFFILSGFLITASFERTPSIGSYVAKRVKRIYPAFLTVALLDLFVVLPLSGGRLAEHTLADKILNVVSQSLRLREFLYAGVFAGNPTSGGINGSLWTLQWEFWCYLLVIPLGVTGLLRSKKTLAVLFALSILASVHAEVYRWPPSDRRFEWVFGDLFFWAALLPMFLAGMVFYRFRGHLSLRPAWIVAACAGMAFAVFEPHAWRLLFPVAGAYLVLALAYHPRIRLHGWSRFGDLSYGTYLYAFPVQQPLMQRIGHPVAAWKLFVLATPITLVCAAASWYGVERWFLQPASKGARTRAMELPV